MIRAKYTTNGCLARKGGSWKLAQWTKEGLDKITNIRALVTLAGRSRKLGLRLWRPPGPGGVMHTTRPLKIVLQVSANQI